MDRVYVLFSDHPWEGESKSLLSIHASKEGAIQAAKDSAADAGVGFGRVAVTYDCEFFTTLRSAGAGGLRYEVEPQQVEP